MALTAFVEEITPIASRNDVVKLVHEGMAYFVDSPVGQLKVGQTVNVKAIGFDKDGAPTHLRLTS